MEDEVPGVSDALANLANNLEIQDEPEEIVTEEVFEEVPQEDLADRVLNKLQEAARQAYETQQRQEAQRYEEMPLEDQYPDGVPVAVVEERATNRAIGLIRVQQTVDDEVQQVISSYESKFGAVPVAVQNQIKMGLRQVPPANMRQGLGTEAARYYIAEAMENGTYTPSAVKTKTVPAGGGGRQMAAATVKTDPNDAPMMDSFKNAFPQLADGRVKEIFGS